MKYLLAIDVQAEFAKGMFGKAAYKKMLNYINTEGHTKYDAVYAAIYKNTSNKNMIRLVHWDQMQDIETIEFKPDEFWYHGGYSIGEYPWFQETDLIDVIGFDTDACVLSTCFDLFNKDIPFRIIADGCYSSGGNSFHKAGLEIMKRQFNTALDLNTKI